MCVCVCVCVCDLGTSAIRRPIPPSRAVSTQTKINFVVYTPPAWWNLTLIKTKFHSHEQQQLSDFEFKCFKSVFFQAFILATTLLSSVDNLLTLHHVLDLRANMLLLYGVHTSTDVTQALTQPEDIRFSMFFWIVQLPTIQILYVNWNFMPWVLGNATTTRFCLLMSTLIKPLPLPFGDRLVLVCRQ